MYILRNTLFLHAEWYLFGWLNIPRKILHLVQINIMSSKNPNKYVKNICAGNLRSLFPISFWHQIPKSNLSESWSYWRNAHWRRRVAPVSSVHSLPLQSRDGTLSYHMYSLWDLQEISHYINHIAKCLQSMHCITTPCLLDCYLKRMIQCDLSEHVKNAQFKTCSICKKHRNEN